MTINELIIAMNNNKAKLLKPEQVQAFLKKELNVIEYMSIKNKKSLVEDIVNECILYDDGIFKFDDIDKYICFTMRTIAAYTNIELSDDIENDYDLLCKEKLLSPVIDTFVGEYENVKLLLQMKCDYILCGNSIEAQLGRFLDNVLNKLSDVTDVLKHSANNLDMNNLPIDKESLMRLFDIVNKI
jgi:hypothetical protein